MEYWSEESCAQLAQDLSSAGPYLETLKVLPSAVLRSDFCRYLVMFGKGGIYSDLDVKLMKPLPWDCMGKPTPNENPPAVIIGLEGDAATTGLPRSPQFVQWTLVSAPAHPILKNVLDRIVQGTPARVKLADDKGSEMDIMAWTGPNIWTDAVLDWIQCSESQLEMLRDLKEPLRIKDVLFLPKHGYAIIEGQDHKLKDIYVKHYFSGTWKTCKKTWIGQILPWGC